MRRHQQRRVSSHLHICHLSDCLFVHSHPRTPSSSLTVAASVSISQRTITMSVDVESTHDHVASSEMSNGKWTVIVAVPVLAGSVAAKTGTRPIALHQVAVSRHFLVSGSHFLSPLRCLHVRPHQGSVHMSASARTAASPNNWTDLARVDRLQSRTLVHLRLSFCCCVRVIRFRAYSRTHLQRHVRPTATARRRPLAVILTAAEEQTV